MNEQVQKKKIEFVLTKKFTSYTNIVEVNFLFVLTKKFTSTIFV